MVPVPSDPEKYQRMQNKELSNGRLAMIGIAGMVAQELAVRMDVLKLDELDIEKLANTDLQTLEALAGITQSIAMFAASGSTTKSKSQQATEYVLQMPGIVAPTGFFDPAGLSRMKTTAQLKYAREAELKHGRVAMLAALGFPFAEEFRLGDVGLRSCQCDVKFGAMPASSHGESHGCTGRAMQTFPLRPNDGGFGGGKQGLG